MPSSSNSTGPASERRFRRSIIGAALLALLVFASLAAASFAMRTYTSLLLLHSAQELGMPDASHVRGWMTLGYLSDTFDVPASALAEKLKLPPNQDGATPLRDVARQQQVPTFEFVQTVQAALADLSSAQMEPEASGDEEEGWWAALGQWFLSGVLVYGYPALGFTFFVGALGLPVPTGLSAVVTGSLVSDGFMNAGWAFLVVVVASVAGDAVGYGAGRLLNEHVIERRGRWFGYTAGNRLRAEALFADWGALTIVLTRTLVSHLSSVVSLLAGMTRYRFREFLVLAVAGRIIWTFAYVGLGYTVGTDFEAASVFLMNLSGFVLSSTLLVALAIVLIRGTSAPASDRN